MSDGFGAANRRSNEPPDHRFHDPQKPNTCPKCGAHVVVLTGGECLECTDRHVTPTDALFENDWSSEKFPDEARSVDTEET